MLQPSQQCYRNIQSLQHFSKNIKIHQNPQKKNILFQWTDKYQTYFDTIKKQFSESTSLIYFDPELPAWIFLDSAKRG